VMKYRTLFVASLLLMYLNVATLDCAVTTIAAVITCKIISENEHRLVGCHTDGTLEGGVKYFAEGGMSVYGERQLFHCRTGGDCVCALLDQICRMNADDMYAKKLTSALIEQNLHNTTILTI
jgi:hypothetical protein